MPKILDRSRWVLLPIGQDQGGGKVIPASVKQEVDKLVDQMMVKIEEQGKKAAQAEAKAGRKR